MSNEFRVVGKRLTNKHLIKWIVIVFIAYRFRDISDNFLGLTSLIVYKIACSQ